MPKMDINVERSMTINCGNYSSIKPTVNITVKDIDVLDLSDRYTKITQILDNLMALEVLALGDEMETIQSIGYKQYVNNIKDVDIDIFNDEIKELLEGI